MKVTPLDIRRKEFKRSVRGYADEEVDLFLDEVADELERLLAENAELLERLRRQEGELSGNQQLREALEKTLVSAQFAADDTRAKARAEADHMLRDAESKAQGIVSDSYTEVQRVQQALVQLKQLEEDFRSKFQSLLQGHLKVLAEPAIATPLAEAVVVQSQPVPVAPAPADEAPAPVPAPGPAPVAETPFVVPAGFGEVPEYRRATAEPAGADPRPEGPAPALEVPAVLQPPAPLLRRDDTGVAGTDEGAPVAPPVIEDLAGTVSDSPTVVNDDSVTLVGEDPLRGFFFSGKDDTAADPLPGGDKGGKNRPRDFEW